MKQHEEIQILNPETGIEDLPPNFRDLEVPEVIDIRNSWQNTKDDLAKKEIVETFSEQLNREWAIETGQIENLYYIQRGVTQTLIERGFQEAILQHGSVNRDPEFVIALLEDQQHALENLFSFVKQERNLSKSYILELHGLMTQRQPYVEAQDSSGNVVRVDMIHGKWKVDPNFPLRGNQQFMYCPPIQVDAEVDRLISLFKEHQSMNVAPEIEAAWVHHRFSQIHPFQDGNGRVARALASLVMIRAGLFPVVVPVDEKELYFESLERADAGDLRSLVLLIARRQEIAFNKSQNLARKLTINPATVEDAIQLLGQAYASRKDVIIARGEKRLAALANYTHTSFAFGVGAYSHLLARSAGTLDSTFRSTRVSLTVTELSTGRAKIADNILDQLLTDDATYEVYSFSLIIELEKKYLFPFIVYTSSPKISDSCEVIVFETIEENRFAKLSSVIWPSNMSTMELTANLSNWKDEVVRLALVSVTKRLYE